MQPSLAVDEELPRKRSRLDITTDLANSALSSMSALLREREGGGDIVVTELQMYGVFRDAISFEIQRMITTDGGGGDVVAAAANDDMSQRQNRLLRTLLQYSLPEYQRIDTTNSGGSSAAAVDVEKMMRIMARESCTRSHVAVSPVLTFQAIES